MGLFNKKKKSTMTDQIKDLMEAMDGCAALFQEVMTEFIKDGVTPDNRMKCEKVHDCESRLDDRLRDIEIQLYEHALIPESRGDVLGILETLEKIPNKFESLAFQMGLQKINLPSNLRDGVQALLELNIGTYNMLRDAVVDMFYDRAITEMIYKIDKEESRSDRLERDLIREIFDMDIDGWKKLQYRDLVKKIGDISDLAQTTTDRLTLAVIKRRS